MTNIIHPSIYNIFQLIEHNSYSVQFSSVTQSCLTLRPHGLQHIGPPCPPSSWSLLKLMSIELMMTSNHVILCLPLLLPPSIFPSIRVFSNESGGWSIGVSASISVLPMNIQDWFPLGWTGWISFVVQGTLKSLLQYHSSKASVLWCSAFFIVQLSHPYVTIL